MSEPDGPTDTKSLQNSDRASAPPSEPGQSAPAVQVSGAQRPLRTGVQPSTVQPEKTVFGVLRQDGNHYQYPQNIVFNDDYEKRLPEDPYCEETAPNARIWRVYNEEAAAYDAVFVGQARDGLDVMLVFAGLFSAVLTSFLVQVSQSLQADYTAMSAILLHDLVSIQLSMTGSPSSLQNITTPSINPLQAFRPDSLTVWVNGLWVVSLTMSLVVALSAVLVKQWLHHYTSIPSGTPGARSHLRHYRFIGLQKWRVNVIVGLFPIVMHISLALFLAGLILFYIPLRTALACAVGVITVVLSLLYLVSNTLPIFFPQCPYQTPLTDFIHHTCLIMRKVLNPLFRSVQTICQHLAYNILSVCRPWIHRHLHSDTPVVMFSRIRTHRVKPSSETLKQLETIAVETDHGELSVDALDWLFKISSNPTVHSLVVQAIGGLPPDSQAYARATWESENDIQDVRQHLFDALEDPKHRAIGFYSVWERLTRSRYFFSDVYPRWYRTLIQVPNTMNFDEPRFTATAWAAIGEIIGPDWFKPGRDLRKFFCTFNGLELHPFVWEGLIWSALAVRSHCFQVDTREDLSDPDYAHIVLLFLPDFKAHDEVSIRRRIGHSRTITLHDALTYYSGDLSEPVQDCLLNMLSCFDDDLPMMLPPRYQLLYKAAKFALCHLADDFWASYRDAGSCRHLELLSKVLRCLHEEYDTIYAEHPYFLAPILKLLRDIIDDTVICDYTAAGWQHPELHDLLDGSFSVILRLLSNASRQPVFVFPSFRRLLQVPENHLSEGQHPLAPSVFETLDLMKTALAMGNEAMYRAFIDGGWMWMLAERCIADYDIQDFLRSAYVEPILAFVRGLKAFGSTSMPELFDYMQQPRNFIITFIMIALPAQMPNNEILLKLLSLKHSSLRHTHRATLDSIINWCQAPNHDDLPSPLVNFFDGKVVQKDGRTVSLDDTLREMLANEWYRIRVEGVARTIYNDSCETSSQLELSYANAEATADNHSLTRSYATSRSSSRVDSRSSDSWD